MKGIGEDAPGWAYSFVLPLDLADPILKMIAALTFIPL